MLEVLAQEQSDPNAYFTCQDGTNDFEFDVFMNTRTFYVSDDLSVNNAYDAIKDNGGTIIIPPGTWPVNGTLAFENVSVSIIGSGMGNSILVWHSSVDPSGISIKGDLRDNCSLVLENLTIKTTVNNNGNAINLIPKTTYLPPLQRFGNFPWFRATNCSFTGDEIYGKDQSAPTSDKGWANIIYAKNALRMVITGCYFAGRNVLDYTLEENRAIWIVPNDDGDYGAENLIDKCVFNWFSTAIYNAGAEGLKINNCNIVACGVGLHNLFEPDNKPCIMLTNSHIHASYRAVWTEKTNGVHILGNHIYVNDDWEGAPIGRVMILADECNKVNISNNDIVSHYLNQPTLGIKLRQCNAGIVSGNMFHNTDIETFSKYISFHDSDYCIARMNTHNYPNASIYEKLELLDGSHNMMEDEISQQTRRN